MENDVNYLNKLANTAIEALKEAYQENPHFKTSGFILAALATVTLLREELTCNSAERFQCDPSEYCAPV